MMHIIALMMLSFLFLVGCKSEKVEDNTQDNDSLDSLIDIEEESTDIKDSEEDGEALDADNLVNQNLLTGLPTLTNEAIGKRPVAVMVNNVEKAMPQYGIDAADVIFEILVEGDQTRFMALYGDYTQVPKICSVRSCRKYFPIMSQGFDAVYVHWGMSETILDEVNSLGLTRYDGMANTGGLYGRDQDKLNQGYSLEHTAYFDGTGLAGAMEQRGERTDLKEDKKGTAFLFNGLNEQVKPNGENCTMVEIEFGAAKASFVYDENTNTYLKNHNGKKQVDAKTGNQLNFTNVIVLETNIGIDPVNDVHKKFDWTGGGNSLGYYVSNGAMQKIKWSKESVSDYLKFYTEDGKELSINRGKTYIAINYLNQSIFE